MSKIKKFLRTKIKKILKLIFKIDFFKVFTRRIYLKKRLDFPSMVQIEITNACNAQCLMCPHDKLTRKIGNIDADLYKKIIDESAANQFRVNTILPNHFGEPLLNPRLYDHIKYAREKVPKSDICIFTNGSLLTEENTIKILDSGLDVINISFDGFSKNTYERIRRNLNFDEVNTNLTRLLALKKKMKKKTPRIDLSYVEIEENKRETEEFIKKWKSLVDKIHIGVFCNWGGMVNGQVVAKGEKVTAFNPKRSPCTRLWSHLLIFRNGDVPLCCQDFNGEYLLGNVATSSIREIWNGEVLNRYRDLHIKGKFNEIPICKACNFWRQQSEPIWWW